MTMQNLLRVCGLDHLGPDFQHKNIYFDDLSLLVDDRASLLDQEELKRKLYHEIGLDSHQLLKI